MLESAANTVLSLQSALLLRWFTPISWQNVEQFETNSTPGPSLVRNQCTTLPDFSLVLFQTLGLKFIKYRYQQIALSSHINHSDALSDLLCRFLSSLAQSYGENSSPVCADNGHRLPHPLIQCPLRVSLVDGLDLSGELVLSNLCENMFKAMSCSFAKFCDEKIVQIERISLFLERKCRNVFLRSCILILEKNNCRMLKKLRNFSFVEKAFLFREKRHKKQQTRQRHLQAQKTNVTDPNTVRPLRIEHRHLHLKRVFRGEQGPRQPDEDLRLPETVVSLPVVDMLAQERNTVLGRTVEAWPRSRAQALVPEAVDRAGKRYVLSC